MHDPTERIFVYGTLRRGGSNHHRLQQAAWICAGAVRGRLYRIDWYPGVVLDDAEGGPVLGEVYAIPAALLEALDEYEGGEYRRREVTVSTPDGACHTAWIWEWLGSTDEIRRVSSGDWLHEISSSP